MTTGGNWDSQASKERQELVRETTALREQITKLADSLRIASNQVRRVRLVTRLVAVALGLAIVALIGAGVVIDQNHQQLLRSKAQVQCIQAWADASTARTQQITGSNIDKQNKLDAIVRTLTIPDPVNQKTARDQAIRDYLTAADKLSAQYKAHPIPPAPKFSC